MKIKQLSIVCLIILFSGCSVVNLSSIKMPGTDMEELNIFYVEKQPTDKRGFDIMIKDQLKEMGFEAFTGKGNYHPDKVDAVVTYSDRWMWDLSNYLIQLTIYIKNTDNEYVACAGKSFRTSLDRKPPEYMIKEILEDVFKSNKNTTL